MLRISNRLLRVNRRCVLLCEARVSTHKRGALSRVVKFEHRKESEQHDNVPKSKYKSFENERTHFDKIDPDADIERDEYEELDDYDDKIINGSKSYNERMREEKWRYNATVRHIMKRKYFKDPPEPNLLTWAAKEQLRYLHNIDPEMWTPEKLAESFPISVSSVKKLLSSAHHIPKQDKILMHDKAVHDRWKQLRKDGGPILAAINPKFLSGKLNIANAMANSNLPLPDNEWKMLNSPKTEMMPRSDAPIGEFENMIVQYKNLLPRPENDSTELALAANQNEIAIYEEPPEIVESFPILPPKLQKANRPVTFDQFKKSVKQHLLKRSIADPEPYKKFNTWLEENDTSTVLPPPPPIEELLDDPILELFDGKIKQYADVAAPEVKWDVHRDAKNPEAEEAYLYESKHGYQRPYGRSEVGDHIEIPQSEWKEGCIYQRGDSYYDDTGEFLYRVPFPVKK